MKKRSEKIRRLRRVKNQESKEGPQGIQELFDPHSRFHNRILAQVNEEYELCWRYCRPKIKENFLRLALYNNQKRDKDRVGDPFMFAVHQTILANLFDDKLQAIIGGRTDRDEPIAEHLEMVYKADSDDILVGMHKSQLDHDWDWDAIGFGNGLVWFNEFDFKTHTPIPIVWDPLTFIHDPRAVGPNGNRLGENNMRFGGREIRKTYWEMEKNPEYINLDNLRRSGEANPLSLTWEARQARREAQGFENIGNWESGIRANYEFVLLQWLTHIDGEKVIVELANDRTLIVRITFITDAQDNPLDEWPIIKRNMFPISHDWEGVSLFDILEDKQRFRATLLNVAGDSAKLAAYPQWLFDENKIRKNQDKNAEFNKWIPVNGPVQGAAMPMPHNPIDETVKYIMDLLKSMGEVAVAAPDIQQGSQMTQGKTKGKTATSVNREAAAIEARYGLTAKIWGWSEAEFVKWWYRMYDTYYPVGLTDKIIRIEGVLGAPVFKDYTRKDLIVSHPLGPNIAIESKLLSEAKKIRQYQIVGDFVKNYVITDPEADSLYTRRRLGRLVMPSAEVEAMIPMTVDEEIAQSENLRLMNGEKVKVDAMRDNHKIHLRVHSELDDTPEARAHVIGHQLAMIAQKTQPELFPGQQGQGGESGAPGGASLNPPKGMQPPQQMNTPKPMGPKQNIVGRAPEGVAGQPPNMQ